MIDGVWIAIIVYSVALVIVFGVGVRQGLRGALQKVRDKAIDN
jgi:hypothetical protein